MLSNAKIVFLASALIGAGAASPAYPPAKTFTVQLTGEAQSNFAHPSGGTGDPNASGSVKLTIDAARKQVCYHFDLSSPSEPMMAHIHQGPPLSNGPPVVTLFTGTNSKLDDCVMWTHGQLAEIVADPSHFYVSVETTGFPDGALRGQLA